MPKRLDSSHRCVVLQGRAPGRGEWESGSPQDGTNSEVRSSENALTTVRQITLHGDIRYSAMIFEIRQILMDRRDQTTLYDRFPLAAIGLEKDR
jgi:hypothetical protein